jgi:hypothetical protein
LILAPAPGVAAQPPGGQVELEWEVQIQGEPELSALERVTSARLDGLRPRRSSSDRPIAALREFEIAARYAVWFDGGPITGLRLQILPRDEDGTVRALDAQVSVELFVRRSTDFAANATSGGWRIERGASWSETISATHSTSRGAVLWLAYPESLRQADSRISPWGTVRIRIVVAGEAPFEYDLESVRLRPYSPLRDTRERQSGRRVKLP